MDKDKIIEQIKEKIQDGLSCIPNITDPLQEALDLFDQAEPSYEPTADEISSYISAWDGDITEEQARVLLKEANRKDEHLPGFDEITGLFCKDKQAEPVCPNCGLTGEQAKLPHTRKKAEHPISKTDIAVYPNRHQTEPKTEYQLNFKKGDL